MARQPLPYSVRNELGKYLSLLQAKRITEKGGIRVNMSVVEQELADYCSVTRDTISMVKRGVNQPSLPLAFKIAQFFEVEVTDIFVMEE